MCFIIMYVLEQLIGNIVSKEFNINQSAIQAIAHAIIFFLEYQTLHWSSVIALW